MQDRLHTPLFKVVDPYTPGDLPVTNIGLASILKEEAVIREPGYSTLYYVAYEDIYADDAIDKLPCKCPVCGLGLKRGAYVCDCGLIIGSYYSISRGRRCVIVTIVDMPKRINYEDTI